MALGSQEAPPPLSLSLSVNCQIQGEPTLASLTTSVQGAALSVGRLSAADPNPPTKFPLAKFKTSGIVTVVFCCFNTVNLDDAFEDRHIIYVDKRDYSKLCIQKKTCLLWPRASLRHQSASSLCFLVTYFIK